MFDFIKEFLWAVLNTYLTENIFYIIYASHRQQSIKNHFGNLIVLSFYHW